MDFIAKIAKQAISMTVARQISKRLGKQLDKAGEAFEKTWQERRETKAAASRERARMTRGVNGAKVDASESSLEKREKEWAKQKPIYREEMIGTLVDLDFSPVIAREAVDQILSDVEEELHHYGVPSPSMLSSTALRRARQLRRIRDVQARLNEEQDVDDMSDRDPKEE